MKNCDITHIVEIIFVIQRKMSFNKRHRRSRSQCMLPCAMTIQNAHNLLRTYLRQLVELNLKLQQKVTSVAPKSPAVVINITVNSIEHGMNDNDDDLISLTRIRREMSHTLSQTDHGPPDEPQSLNDSIISNT